MGRTIEWEWKQQLHPHPVIVSAGMYAIGLEVRESGHVFAIVRIVGEIVAPIVAYIGVPLDSFRWQVGEQEGRSPHFTLPARESSASSATNAERPWHSRQNIIRAKFSLWRYPQSSRFRAQLACALPRLSWLHLDDTLHRYPRSAMLVRTNTSSCQSPSVLCFSSIIMALMKLGLVADFKPPPHPKGFSLDGNRFSLFRWGRRACRSSFWSQPTGYRRKKPGLPALWSFCRFKKLPFLGERKSGSGGSGLFSHCGKEVGTPPWESQLSADSSCRGSIEVSRFHPSCNAPHPQRTTMFLMMQWAFEAGYAVTNGNATLQPGFAEGRPAA